MNKVKIYFYGFITLIFILVFVKTCNDLNNSRIEMFKINSQEKHYFVHIPKNAGSAIYHLLENKDLNIEYIGHNYPKINENEIVILRDPIDRFISAFYFRIQMAKHRYSKINKIETDIFKNVNEFTESLIDKTSKKHKYANMLFKNRENQTINNKYIENKWLFTEQYKWFNNPKYVLRFTHLEEDLNKCIKDIGYNKHISLPKSNNNKIHNDRYLSDKSVAFLKEHYKKDFELLESNPFTYVS